MVTVQVLMGVFVRVCSTEAQYTDLQSADINAYGSNSLSYADELCAKKDVCASVNATVLKAFQTHKAKQTETDTSKPSWKKSSLEFFCFF